MWTRVMSNRMICASFISHLAYIFLVTDNGIMFTNALESAKQLCTLKLKISKFNRNGWHSAFSSIVKELSTCSRELEDVLDPLSEEASLPMVD